MDILTLIAVLLSGYFAVDAKMELNELKKQPPKIVTVIKTVEVEIPIATQCPIPDDITKPVLEISKLTPADKDDFRKVASSYVVSLAQCMSYAEQQEQQLDSYRKEIVE